MGSHPQVGQHGHSSVEDAVTAMALYRLVEVQWEQQEASSHMEQVLGSVSFQIPHSREVETQYLEGDMLAELGLKESRAFRKEIEKISKEVFGV